MYVIVTAEYYSIWYHCCISSLYGLVCCLFPYVIGLFQLAHCLAWSTRGWSFATSRTHTTWRCWGPRTGARTSSSFLVLGSQWNRFLKCLKKLMKRMVRESLFWALSRLTPGARVSMGSNSTCDLFWVVDLFSLWLESPIQTDNPFRHLWVWGWGTSVDTIFLCLVLSRLESNSCISTHVWLFVWTLPSQPWQKRLTLTWPHPQSCLSGVACFSTPDLAQVPIESSVGVNHMLIWTVRSFNCNGCEVSVIIFIPFLNHASYFLWFVHQVWFVSDFDYVNRAVVICVLFCIGLDDSFGYMPGSCTVMFL